MYYELYELELYKKASVPKVVLSAIMRRQVGINYGNRAVLLSACFVILCSFFKSTFVYILV